MNTESTADSPDNLKDQGGKVLDTIKDAARDKVIDPVIEAGKSFSNAAHEGAAKVADYSRRAAHSTDEWVGGHRYSAIGIAFGLGVLLGVVVTAQVRS